MKKALLIVSVLVLSLTATSCGTTSSAMKQTDTQVAGYTLKDKKEIVEQKILHKNNKTVIATP